MTNTQNKTTLAKKLLACLEADTPSIVWSDPGMGKTFTATRVAEELKWECHTEIASLHEPTDYSGVPYVSQDQVKVSPPELIQKLNKHKKVLLFLDELPTSPRATQNILLRLIHEGVIGEHKLHAGVRIVAAGNFVNVAGNILLSTALANRFIHIFHKPTIQEWIEGDTKSDPINIEFDENWKDMIPEMESMVFSFVETYPEYFSTMPEQIEKAEDYAYCSPRSWKKAARLLALSVNDPDLGKELCFGTIGVEPTKKLFTFMRSMDKMASFKKINLDKFKFPDDPSQVMILLKSAALYSKEAEHGDKAVRLFNMAYSEGFRPLSMKYSKLLAKNLSSHMKPQDILKALPFVGQILGKKS